VIGANVNALVAFDDRVDEVNSGMARRIRSTGQSATPAPYFAMKSSRRVAVRSGRHHLGNNDRGGVERQNVAGTREKTRVHVRNELLGARKCLLRSTA
jgi:hypothetical protein